MLAGMISRTLAVSIVSPLELIKTKLQSQQLDYKRKFTYLLELSNEIPESLC